MYIHANITSSFMKYGKAWPLTFEELIPLISLQQFSYDFIHSRKSLIYVLSLA
jgi:hypothetical protein